MKYNIKRGDIYIAADGSKQGHLVTDIATFEKEGDVVTTPFSAQGVGEPGQRIDAFKLAMCRYYKPTPLPTWIPKEIQNNALNVCAHKLI